MSAFSPSPTFIPRTGEPQPFVSVDALAVHLLRQRPGRRLEVCPGVCFRGDDDGFPVVSVFAMRTGDRLARRRDAIRSGAADAQDLSEEWLGWATGERAGDPVEIEAALNRMRSAGGLAA